MKKIECIIMDWAGTAVDYGCFAPVAAFMEAFAEKGLVIDVVQTRKPMGLPKIQHIRELLSMPEVNGQFVARYQRAWTEEDVVELNRLFEKHLFASLENYTLSRALFRHWKSCVPKVLKSAPLPDTPVK